MKYYWIPSILILMHKSAENAHFYQKHKSKNVAKPSLNSYSFMCTFFSIHIQLTHESAVLIKLATCARQSQSIHTNDMRHTHFIDVNQLINIISGGVEYFNVYQHYICCNVWRRLFAFALHNCSRCDRKLCSWSQEEMQRASSGI